MMRYQRVSPDPSPNRVTSPSPSETKSLRGRSASDGPSTSTSPNHCDDLLLQWGHNKRTRGPRTAQAQAQDESSSSHKRQRRASNVAEKLMPPPQLPVGSCTRAGNLRSSASLPPNYRAVDEHRSRAGDKRPQTEKKSNNHHSEMNPKQHQPSDHDLTVSSNGNGGEKSLEHFEWPRIYISLSRKEKEDDFLAMKGTRLPQRPKKRAKNVDKTLQYVFPGMWLSDLTRGRYEVREKKCVKKKRRGLKGMENVDSDSE